MILAVVVAVVMLFAGYFIGGRPIGELRLESERRIGEIKEESESRMSELKNAYERRIEELKGGYEKQLADSKGSCEKQIADLKVAYDKQLNELKETYEKSLKEQLDAVNARVTAETEKILKAREEELSKKAEETFKTISGTLEKDLKEMKDSFELNKKVQSESSASMKTHLEEAVKHLKSQTESIGNKADNLASALKGDNKMQGCWGEIKLENIFKAEGLEEGIDYHREETLKDTQGNIIINENTGRRMRPDFIIHFPDKTDIAIDSKVNLAALSDWYAAKDEQDKEEAAKRNLAAIKEQIEKLAKKEYVENLSTQNSILKYVIMFIPNFAAFQLAKNLDADIWRNAYNKNVLITTEETLMPFLRMVHAAWVNQRQIENQQAIIKSASLMIDRVHDFCDEHIKLGNSLKNALAQYNSASAKLRDDGHSIIVAAKGVTKLGVPEKPKKAISQVKIEDIQV